MIQCSYCGGDAVSGCGPVYGNAHHYSKIDCAEFLKKERDRLNLQKQEMADHAARLRVCLLRYGSHYDNCASKINCSKQQDCDCGLEANIQAVPGQTVEVPKEVKRKEGS